MGAQKVVGVGHSLGGVLTLYAALKQPDLFSHVILIDPTMLSPKLIWQIRVMKLFGLEARSWLVKGALRRRREWGSIEEAFEYFRGRGLFKNWSDEMVRTYTESMTGPALNGGIQLIYPPEWEARIYKTIPADVWKFAKQLQQPTLVIRGETSNTFTADSEKAFIKAKPNGRFEVVQEAGHLVPQEKPEETAKLIVDFLRR
jgi:pimeloyl-ACP methyl ester carboxylesterase